jgi:hypothetical protein
MILGLPGETKESFMRGVRDVIDSGVSMTTIYSLMMLYGTQFKDPAYRAEFGMEGKFRIVPLNFGDYDGVKVFDYEEACIKTKDMSFADYLELRRLAIVVETVHNNGPFESFFRYAMTLGLSRADFLFLVFDNIHRAPREILQLFDEFESETRGELWDSDKAMIEHYRKDENYRQLLKGDVGGNLIYKYKSKNLATAMPQWIEFLATLLEDIVVENGAVGQDATESRKEIRALSEFCQSRIWKFLDEAMTQTDVTMNSDYDFVAWLKNSEPKPLNAFRSDRPIRYVFGYTENQARLRGEQFRRYGTDINALSKIVTRVHVEDLFRTVWADSVLADGRGDGKTPSRTRYAMSN